VSPVVSVLTPVAQPNAAHAFVQCAKSEYCAFESMQFAVIAAQ
jgi:hypothetical protein